LVYVGGYYRADIGWVIIIIKEISNGRTEKNNDSGRRYERVYRS